MKKRLFLIFMAISCLGTFSQSWAKDVTLQWDPNLEPNVAGYKLYYKANSSTGPFTGTDAVQGNSPLNLRDTNIVTLNGLDAGKSYFFQVTAYDTAGNESTFSNMVQSYESTAPTVSITAPAAGSAVSGSVSVVANASDNNGVAKVEFLVNNVVTSTATASPYTFKWNVVSLSAGTYTITAKAYDEAGNMGTSNISVTVNNYNPVPAGSGKGDINGDGNINIADALTLLRAALNPSLQSSSIKSAGDVWPLDGSGKPMGDGVIDLNDARLILQRAVGLVAW